MKKKILIYNDSAEWGGHEKMTALLANSIAQTHDVTFLYYEESTPTHLNDAITTVRLPFYSKTPLPFIRNLNPFKILQARRLIIKHNPDVLIVAQGCIERSLYGVFAGRLAGIKTISYIPLAFLFKEINGGFATIRDVWDRLYYKLPQQYLTVNEFQKKMLQRFSSIPVETLYNPVEGVQPKELSSLKPVHIGVIGRVYDQHKNILILSKVSKILMERGYNHVFHIIGDGADSNKLQQVVIQDGVSYQFRLHGWVTSEKLDELYRTELDIISVTAHYESCLPLSILDGVGYNLPFIVSDKPFVEEYHLNDSFTFDNTDPESIADTIVNFENISVELLNRTMKQVRSMHSMTQYKKRILDVL